MKLEWESVVRGLDVHYTATGASGSRHTIEPRSTPGFYDLFHVLTIDGRSYKTRFSTEAAAKVLAEDMESKK